ncbi:MAG: HRDC domain-containing protein [bacterium]|nr:HRDC domain-containing protein [bacterium]
MKDKEVLSVRDHFFVKDEFPYMAMVVTYNMLRPEAEVPASPRRQQEKERREEWRQMLEEQDWPLFNALRDWRNGQAKEEGIPPYVICTNRQLAEIAHKRPQSLNKLATVEGLGKAKLERYGAAILELVGQEAQSEAEDTAGGPDEQPSEK